MKKNMQGSYEKKHKEKLWKRICEKVIEKRHEERLRKNIA